MYKDKALNLEQENGKIQEVDWNQYIDPDCYDPKRVVPALLDLLNFKKNSDAIANNILFAIGNNYRGTYYPALFSALEILLTIEQDRSNADRKSCAFAILNNLYYF